MTQIDPVALSTVADYLADHELPVGRDRTNGAIAEILGIDVSQVDHVRQGVSTLIDFDPVAVTRYTEYCASSGFTSVSREVPTNSTRYWRHHRAVSNVWNSYYDFASHLSEFQAGNDVRRKMQLMLLDRNSIDLDLQNHAGFEQQYIIQMPFNRRMTEACNTGTIKTISDSMFPSGWFARAFYLDQEAYSNAIRPFVEDLLVEGWDIVNIELSNNSPEVHSVPFCAMPPEGHTIKQAVLLLQVRDYQTNAHLISMLMSKMAERWPVEDSWEFDADLVRSYIAAFQSVEQIRGARSSEYEEIANRLARRENDIESTRNSLASMIRAANDDRNLRRTLARNQSHVVVSAIQSIAAMNTFMDELRQIDEWHIDNNRSETILVMKTYPFGMTMVEYPWDDEIEDYDREADPERAVVLIPPMTIKIMLTATNWQCVTISCEGSSLFHPHINSSGSICWGDAANGLAESWGRRDWESFIRLILAWCTQYSELNGPYHSLERMSSYCELTERKGWHRPVEGEQVEVEQVSVGQEPDEENPEQVALGEELDPELVPID